MSFLPHQHLVCFPMLEDQGGLDGFLGEGLSVLRFWEVIFQGCYQLEALVVSYKDPMQTFVMEKYFLDLCYALDAVKKTKKQTNKKTQQTTPFSLLKFNSIGPSEAEVCLEYLLPDGSILLKKRKTFHQQKCEAMSKTCKCSQDTKVICILRHWKMSSLN